MAYNIHLADRIREYLFNLPKLTIEEKAMFGGLAFMVNGKMCICVSGDNLMCRFDPLRVEEVAERRGYLPMVMKGKVYKGYCLVDPTALQSKKELDYWMSLCLEYNKKVQPSKKKQQ
jgi:TfoX/Sxy family transcriptional regulator of competence genes